MPETIITSNPSTPWPDAWECGWWDNIETTVVTTGDIETK